MDWNEITLTDHMTATAKYCLEHSDDSLSLYTRKLIDSLEQKNTVSEKPAQNKPACHHKPPFTETKSGDYLCNDCGCYV